MEILNMNKKYIAISSVVVFLLLLIYSINPLFALDHGSSSASIMEERARQALESLRYAYTERDIEGFFQQVSDKPCFNSLELKSNISSQFNNFDTIDLNIVTDNTLPSHDKILINTHWQKRMLNQRTGKLQTSEGNAQFIFKVKQKAKLVDIKQNSPF